MTGDEIQKLKRENARLKSLVEIADTLIPPKGSWHRKWMKAKKELGYAERFDVVCDGGFVTVPDPFFDERQTSFHNIG